MASRSLFGDARITWTPPGQPSPEVFLLGAPLVELEPLDVQASYTWWSEDNSSREIVLVGDAVRDLVATIRFDDQPAELKRILRAGLYDDVTLNYQKNIGGTTFALRLVTVVGAQGGAVAIQRDRDRGSLGEWEVRIHVRGASGASLDGLLPGGLI